MFEIEAQRQSEQERLDRLKTLEERNRLGQFASPPALALDIARSAAARWGGRLEKVAFLDPEIGSGSFYSAVRQAFRADAIEDACGVEIDPAFAKAARILWQGTGLRVFAGDFTALEPDRKYNLVLANPPDVERAEAERRGIPGEFVKPILPSSRHLEEDMIEADADGHPRLQRSLVVIDCDWPEDPLRDRHAAFWSYLHEGREQGIHADYLGSRRSPWNAQERRDPAPFLCTYMGRRRANGNPSRFFTNRSRATAANVYLMLHPRGPLRAALDGSPELARLVLSRLRSIAGEHLISEGRVYGGGLHKLERRELLSLPAEAPAQIMNNPAAEPAIITGWRSVHPT